MSCLICFTDFSDNEPQIRCGHPKCVSLMCKDCANMLIEHSLRESIIPVCPNRFCKQPITLNKHFDQTNYGLALINYFLTQKEDSIKKELQHEKVLDNIRKDRIKFIYSTFQICVSLTIDIALKSKLNKIDKSRQLKIKNELEKSNRNCMNLTCKGFLDPNFKCMLCDTQFCNKCEKKIVQGHICKQDDIESINTLNTFTKCPKCNIIVQKSEGCDSITCANCKTLFEYSTGKEGGHGSSNKLINLKNRTLSDIVKPEFKGIVLEIEKGPKPVNEETLNKILKCIIQETYTKESCAVTFGKAFTNYIIAKWKISLHQGMLSEIEELNNKEELTYTILEEFKQRLPF